MVNISIYRRCKGDLYINYMNYYHYPPPRWRAGVQGCSKILGLGLGLCLGFWFVFENWCLGGRTILPSGWPAHAPSWGPPQKTFQNQ